MHLILSEKMKKSRQIYIPLLLLTLFVAYQLGITMFSHVHYINGVMIVHSHPSSDNHNHTEGQILTLAQVSDYVGTQPVLVESAELHLPVLYTLKCHRELAICQSQHIQCISLRAPPSIV